MASYLQNPNFDTYNFRPYNSPVNEIAQAIGKRSQMWEVAASQVKNAQMQAAGLSLSRGESKEALNQFMTKADDQMRKAARTDLSVGDNRVAAMNIFKPLYEDQKIMLDHSITEFYQQQGQLAQTSKMRDGGKDFSQTNLSYMQEKYQDFMNDPNYDAETLQKHYNEKRGYTPYYNYNTEFENILKNCGTNSYTSQTPALDKNGEASLYFDIRSDEGISSDKLSGCLSSGLSDRAKTQMGIEGYMSYGKNYQGLATDYIRHSDEELKVFNTKKGATDGRIAGLRAKPNLTEAERLELAQLEQSSTQYGEYITDQLKTRDLVAGGDETFIRQNYERLAAPLYTKGKINQFAQYYQRSKQVHKIEENNAAMLTYKTQADFDQLAERFKHEREMAKVDFGYDVQLESMKIQGRLAEQELQNQGKVGANGSSTEGLSGITRVRNDDGTYRMVSNYANVDGRLGEENLVQNGTDVVNQRFDNAMTRMRDADNFLLNSFQSKFPQYKTAAELKKSPEFQNYLKAFPDDDDVKEYLNASREAGKEVTRLTALKENVDLTISRQAPELLKNNTTGLSPIQLPNGMVVPPERIMNALSGGDPEIRITREPSASGQAFGMGSNWGIGGQAATDPVMYFRGQRIPISGPALQQYQKIFERGRDQSAALKKKRDELFGEKIFEVDNRKDIGNDNFEKNNSLKNRLAVALGVDNDQVLLKQSDLKGAVWFSVVEGKKPLPENILETLKSGFKVDKEGNNYRLTNVPEYTIFTGSNDHYRNELLTVNSMIQVNKDKLAQNIPVEIPIQGRADLQRGSSEASYKLIVKKGPSNNYIYRIARKGPDGNYQQALRGAPSEIEAIKIIEEIDKLTPIR